VAAAPWWVPVNNSDWRHPEGPGSDIKHRSVNTYILYKISVALLSISVIIMMLIIKDMVSRRKSFTF
jgi:hypothetical protein